MNERLIDDILKHLDKETEMGVVRMSVEMDEKSDKGVEISHKCCNMYGRPANETVGLLDPSISKSRASKLSFPIPPISAKSLKYSSS